jgi:hypothetical protein
MIFLTGVTYLLLVLSRTILFVTSVRAYVLRKGINACIGERPSHSSYPSKHISAEHLPTVPLFL